MTILKAGKLKFIVLMEKLKYTNLPKRSIIETLFLEDSIYESTVDIKYLSNRMISKLEGMDKYQFRNYVDKNQIIENWMIEKIPDVNKGEEVKAVYSKSNITLTLAAKSFRKWKCWRTCKDKIRKK